MRTFCPYIFCIKRPNEGRKVRKEKNERREVPDLITEPTNERNGKRAPTTLMECRESPHGVYYILPLMI